MPPKKLTKLNKTVKERKHVGITLPLYFGWQIRIVMERIKDLRKHIVGPFRQYWQFITAVFILILLTSAFFFFRHQAGIYAATYNWTQNDWSGGASTTATALHPGDRDYWDQYQSADSSLSASSSVGIIASLAALTHTTASDFSAGTSTGAIASTTLDALVLDLP
jgi:hypothetical protein